MSSTGEGHHLGYDAGDAPRGRDPHPDSTLSDALPEIGGPPHAKRPPVQRPWSETRYEVRKTLGTGGMGVVLSAIDPTLQRRVALKFLHRKLMGNDAARSHFVAEAQVASQLDHPGVPPIYELGAAADGRPYYAMKQVRGQTLAKILHQIYLNDGDVREEYSLRRLVSILERIAETLAFAHEHAVVHRDVKPANIMIGRHGEVHLIDWGLAHFLDERGAPQSTVNTVRKEASLGAQLGQIKGTVAYMSPEQVLGEAVSARSDIYALGCVLYQIQTLQPPFEPDAPHLLARIIAGEPREPRFVEGWYHSRTLMAIARRAMALNPDDRVASASAFGALLRSWLDSTAEGRRRKKNSFELTERGRNLAREYAEARKLLRRKISFLEAMTLEQDSWAPLSEKRGLLVARREVDELETKSALLFGDATHLLEAALAQKSSNLRARKLLTTLWRAKLLAAEEGQDRQEAAVALAKLRRLDKGGGLQDFLDGTGWLNLTSDPPGATVTLYPQRDRDGLFEVRGRKELGPTPLQGARIPMGSYVCVLKYPGRRTVRYPIHMSRSGDWEGHVELPKPDAILPGFAYVPAGRFVFGDGPKRRVCNIDSFAIQKLPVTFGDYVEFLLALEAEKGRAAALDRLPRHPTDGLYVQGVKARHYRLLPKLLAGATRQRALAKFGEDMELRLPVVGVTWDDAVAYCEWRSEETGRRWRLPSELEFEKAARGVDARTFPWGELEDAALAKCLGSRPGRPHPEPVGSFESAASVFGMRDAAGGVWQWTSSWSDNAREAKVVRGGSWGSPTSELRCTFRRSYPTDQRSQYIGFRCAQTLDPLT